MELIGGAAENDSKDVDPTFYIVHELYMCRHFSRLIFLRPFFLRTVHIVRSDRRVGADGRPQ